MSNTIIQIHIDDNVELKKPHPCGNKTFKVSRIGADVRIDCLKCGRALTLERIKFEKMIKKIVSVKDNS
jgi:hypothetical protein